MESNENYIFYSIKESKLKSFAKPPTTAQMISWQWGTDPEKTLENIIKKLAEEKVDLIWVDRLCVQQNQDADSLMKQVLKYSSLYSRIRVRFFYLDDSLLGLDRLWLRFEMNMYLKRLHWRQRLCIQHFTTYYKRFRRSSCWLSKDGKTVRDLIQLLGPVCEDLGVTPLLLLTTLEKIQTYGEPFNVHNLVCDKTEQYEKEFRLGCYDVEDVRFMWPHLEDYMSFSWLQSNLTVLTAIQLTYMYTLQIFQLPAATLFSLAGEILKIKGIKIWGHREFGAVPIIGRSKPEISISLWPAKTGISNIFLVVVTNRKSLKRPGLVTLSPGSFQSYFDDHAKATYEATKRV
jgi:hypothetical protein